MAKQTFTTTVFIGYNERRDEVHDRITSALKNCLEDTEFNKVEELPDDQTYTEFDITVDVTLVPQEESA